MVSGCCSHLIAKYGLQLNISLTGELPHTDVLKWMQRAKLLLHPSSYEGFGIVSIEALCAGCEVISFVKPMKREIKNWHIVSDKDEMIAQVFAILQNRKPKYEAIVPYTIEDSVQKMVELFSF